MGKKKFVFHGGGLTKKKPRKHGNETADRLGNSGKGPTVKKQSGKFARKKIGGAQEGEERMGGADQ